MRSWHSLKPARRIAFVTALTLAGACEFSDTNVDETKIERIVITDQDGRHWDVTQAVVRYGFDPGGFLFGIGASKLSPFVSPRMAAPGDSGYPDPADGFTVVGVAGPSARAYRVDDLLDVEVADDAAGGAPFAVVVRPLRGAGASPSVHSRVLGTDTLTLGASGWVYGSESILFDRETGSMWYRLEGNDALTCIAGPHFTRRLPSVRAFVEPWSSWRAGHPGTLFMLRPPPPERG